MSEQIEQWKPTDILNRIGSGPIEVRRMKALGKGNKDKGTEDGVVYWTVETSLQYAVETGLHMITMVPETQLQPIEKEQEYTSDYEPLGIQEIRRLLGEAYEKHARVNIDFMGISEIQVRLHKGIRGSTITTTPDSEFVNIANEVDKLYLSFYEGLDPDIEALSRQLYDLMQTE